MALGDVLLTRDDIVRWLMDLPTPMAGHRSIALSDWLVNHRSELGVTYANELKRHLT